MMQGTVGKCEVVHSRENFACSTLFDVEAALLCPAPSVWPGLVIAGLRKPAHNPAFGDRRPSDRDRVVATGTSRFRAAGPEVLR
jgi:hypothetical protein